MIRPLTVSRLLIFLPGHETFIKQVGLSIWYLIEQGCHRSSLVTEAAEKLDITSHYLPPYCPNLKPIKRLWKVMNK